MIIIRRKTNRRGGGEGKEHAHPPTCTHTEFEVLMAVKMLMLVLVST
jgi:hypothetical protein